MDDYKTTTTINWSYKGSTNFSCGTGATIYEKVIACAGAFVGLALYGYFFLTKMYPWTYWQYALATILGVDVAGGLVSNCLNSSKRFYSSSFQSDEMTIAVRLLKQHWIFTMVHIHPIIVQWCFGLPHTWFYGLFWYFALQLSSFVVLIIPLYLRRPTSMLFCLISLILNCYITPLIDGFEWLIPALFIKIVYGHLVPEEPYRPITELQTDIQ